MTLPPDAPAALPAPAAPLASPAVPPPAAVAPPEPPAIVPLTAEELSQWRTRRARARDAQQLWHKAWEANLDAYQPKPETLTADPSRYEVNPNVDFRQVEQKKAQLFYDRPEVVLEPEEPLTTELGAQQLVTLRQALLNKLLGPKPDGVDVLRTVQRALLDIIAIAGIGWTKIGWLSVTKSVPPDAETLAAGGPPYPVDVPIHERFFWDYLPVKRGLIPHDAIGLDADEWDWIGVDFTMPLTQAVREFQLPPDFEPKQTDTDPSLRKTKFDTEHSVKQVSGTEIHYYRSRFHDDVTHPEVVYELVLIDGLEGPARHRPCPYQELDADGRLTADSVTGYLIHPLSIRDAATGAYPLSDSSVTRPLVEQLKVYLGQQVMLRDASQPVVIFKESAIDGQQRDALKGNGYLRVFPIDDATWDAMNIAGPPIQVLAMPTQSRDNYEGMSIFERKIEQSLGINSNQQGVFSTGRRSATEAQAVNAASDTLLAAQQARLTDGFLKGVRKLDALIQRMGKPTYVKILGPSGAQGLQQVDPKLVPGRMLYKIRPDSQLRVDAAQDRAQFLQYYNFAAPSPNTNRLELDNMAARKFGMDPAKVVVPPAPPPPPPPKLSVSVSMADLLTPARPVAAKLLLGQQPTPDDFSLVEQLLAEAQVLPVDAQGDALPVAGGTASTEPVGQGQPEHPGPVEKAEQLDAHQERRTAGLEGVGV